MPLHFRGAVTAVLDWLASLPTTVLDARPSLWVRYASLSLMAGQTTGVEEKLQAAEAALAARLPSSDDKTRDLIGQIAAARATLALTQLPARNHDHPVAPRPGVSAPRQPAFPHYGYLDAGVCLPSPGRPRRGRPGLYRSHIYQPGVREYLFHHTGYNRPGPGTGIGKPALSGGRDLPARPATGQAISRSRLPAKRILAWPASATNGTTWMPPSSTGNRASNWRGSMISVIDRFIICEVFLARLKLAQGDVAGAAAMLAEAEQSARQHNFVHRMPEVAAAQVLVLLRPGQSGGSRSSGPDARTPPQPGPGTPGPGRPIRSAGGAGAIAPADGSKGLAG